MFLLSNRGPQDLYFWPFGVVQGIPLGASLLAMLVLGFLAGLLFHLPTRLALGRRARRAERRVVELESRPLPAPPT